MKNKPLAWLLVFLCLCFLLTAACGDGTDGSEDGSTKDALLSESEQSHAPVRPTVTVEPLASVQIRTPYGSAAVNYDYDFTGGTVVRSVEALSDGSLYPEGKADYSETFTLSENGNLLSCVKVSENSGETLRYREFGYLGGVLSSMRECRSGSPSQRVSADAVCSDCRSAVFGYGSDEQGKTYLWWKEESDAEGNVVKETYLTDSTGLLTGISCEEEGRRVAYSYTVKDSRILSRTVLYYGGDALVCEITYRYAYDGKGRIVSADVTVSGEGGEGEEIGGLLLPPNGRYEVTYTYCGEDVPAAYASASEELRFFTASYGYITDLDSELLAPGILYFQKNGETS